MECLNRLGNGYKYYGEYSISAYLIEGNGNGSGDGASWGHGFRKGDGMGNGWGWNMGIGYSEAFAMLVCSDPLWLICREGK